jgi:hypothetical protein
VHFCAIDNAIEIVSMSRETQRCATRCGNGRRDRVPRGRMTAFVELALQRALDHLPPAESQSQTSRQNRAESR